MTLEERERLEMFDRNCNLLNSLIVIIWAICLISAKILGLTFDWNTMSDLNLASTGAIICLIHFLYTIASIKPIWADELAIQLLGGSYLRELKPGWRYVPFAICDIVKETKNIIEKDVPGSPEEIFYGDTTENKGVVPTGYIPALYITFAANPEADKALTVTVKTNKGTEKKITVPADDPLLKRLIAQVQGSYGFRIKNLKLLYETVGDIDSVVARMDDIVTAGFRSKLAHMTVAEANLRLEEVAEEIRMSLVEAVEAWGIEVQFVRITNLANSHSLNQKISGVAEADEQRKATISTSIGKATEIRNIGAAEADARKDLLAATAEGEAERAIVASSPGGQFTMAVEAIRDGLSKGQTVFVPTDNPFAAIGGIKKMFDGMPKTEEAKTPLTEELQQKPEPSMQQAAVPEPKPAPRYGSGQRKKKGKK